MIPQNWVMGSLKMYATIHEVYQENHEKLVIGIDSWKKKV